MSNRQIVTLGPFVGGLNNSANTPDTIGDTELIECVDFDYNIDGTLVTRPPVAVEPLTTNGTIDHKYFNILGCFVDPATGDSYTIAEINTHLFSRKNSTSFKDALTWTDAGAGAFGVATAGVQYVDKFYIQKGSAGGGSWSVAGGYVAVASMPAGSSLAVFKERLWSAAGTTSRLSFSNIGTGDTWTGADFIDINAGDGQKLISVYASASALNLFKTDSTFVLTYDSAPTRGYVQNISRTIGVFNNSCVTVYEGTIFVLHGRYVYRLEGYSYSRLNVKVDIARDSTVAAYPLLYSLSTVGDRILVSYNNLLYAYYPLTNTWTQWDLPPVAKWWYIPNSIQKYGYGIYVVAANDAAPAAGSILSIQDTDYNVSIPEDLIRSDPRLRTKMYTFDSPHNFKRLHWWGVDAIVTEIDQSANLRMEALPYTFSSYYTWDALSAQTWDFAGTLTWADLLQSAFAVIQVVHVISKDRKYIKADKSLRFPRIQFFLQLDGYRHTARSSVNHLVLDLSQKESPVAKSEGTRV